MKKIHKLCKKLLGHYYKDYQIRVTNSIIEVKLTPRKDEDLEVVYLQDNTSQGRDFLRFSLEDELESKN